VEYRVNNLIKYNLRHCVMVHSFDLMGQEKEEGMKTLSKTGMSCFILVCLLVFLSGSFIQAQTEIWSYEQSGKAYSNVYGGDGNIYATGSMGTGVGRDIFIVSLDDSGDEQWSYTYDGTASGADEGRTITYGEDDNIYVVGFTTDSTTLKDIAIISLDTLGNEQWFYTYDGTASGADDGFSIVYGADGNIYVAGFANDTGTGKDFVVISVDNMGNERWVYTYDGTASSNDEATSVIYGSDGNIYAVGYSTETGHNEDFIVVSLDNTGDENWVYLYNGSSSPSKEDRARSIVYGLDGYLYAAGFSTEAGTRQDFTIISLDVAGNERWVYLYDGLYNGTVDADGAHAIMYGGDDNLYAAGYAVEEQSYNKDFAVISVDTAGNERWVYTRHGSGSTPVDMAYSLVYGSGDSIYVAGYIDQGAENDNIVVVSLDTLGQLNWFYKKDGGGAPMNQDQGRSIAYNPDGNLYVAGYLQLNTFAVISVYPGLLPAMWSYPNFIMVVADSGETVDRELKISNVGAEECPPLEWSVTERPPVEWLDEDLTSGSIDYGDTVTVTVTFDATELTGGIYYDTLEITSNDPVQPTKDVWVKLTVNIPGIEEHTDADSEDRCELLSSFFEKAILLRFTTPSDTPCEIVLYNVLGARVYETALSSTPSSLSLDDTHISRLSHGVYFLSVSRSENVYPVMKLVKF
jgi:hypothetical protein